MLEGMSKVALGIGLVMAAPVVAVTAIEIAAAAGVVAVVMGASEGAVVTAGVAAAFAAEKATTTAGLAKIAQGAKRIGK